MVDDDPLTDPAVVEALKRIGSKDPVRDLCPGCSRRELPRGADWCDVCADERERAAKRDWWRRQSDPAAQRTRVGARDAAVRWLAHRLRRGPASSKAVRHDAHDAGISSKTLRRAREQLQSDGQLLIHHGWDQRRGVHTTTWEYVPKGRGEDAQRGGGGKMPNEGAVGTFLGAGSSGARP